MDRLFWLVYGQGDDIILFIQPAGSLGFARLKAAMAGMDGELREGHELDAKTARRIPKAQITKPLDRKQIDALLKKLR
jgi:hypothetical protein